MPQARATPGYSFPAGAATSPLRQHRPARRGSISAAAAAEEEAAVAAAGNTGVGRGRRTIEGRGWPRRGRPCKSRMPGRTPAATPPTPQDRAEQSEGGGKPPPSQDKCRAEPGTEQQGDLQKTVGGEAGVGEEQGKPVTGVELSEKENPGTHFSTARLSPDTKMCKTNMRRHRSDTNTMECLLTKKKLQRECLFANNKVPQRER